MAKKHLEQYDKNGNRLDIYLNKDEVMVDNKTLGAKLNEMDAAIAISGGGGGYSLLHVITNINTLQEKIDEVIGKLANSAFSVSPKPETIGDFSWQSDEPVDTYYTVSGIDSLSTMYSVTNDASLVLGGTTYTNTITAKTGYDLLSVSVNGTAQVISNDTCTISISNVQSDISIVVTAAAEANTFSISYSLTHCHKTDASPVAVLEGGSFTANILPDEGYTLNGVTASGSGFTQTYDSTNDKIVISASNVQSNIVITCSATTFQVSVNYNLTGFESESNTTMQSGGSFVKELSPNQGYKVKTIVITMGGVTLDNSQVWDASNNTITIPVVTGDIVITATAEESTAHLITYNLTGCTKVNGDDEVEDGGLTAVLAKDTSSWDGVTDFLARDIVVMMGGLPLERGVDFTTSQSSANSDITVTISSVTGNVEIMNVVWKNHYIFFENYNGVSAGDDGGTNDRSAFTETYIPISANSESLAVYGHNTNDGSSTAIIEAYAWGCAVYNSGKVFTKGLFLTKDECTFDISDVNADFIRTSAWLKTTPDLNRINMCYIYDITNDKFIWYGTSVDKTSIRNNHQS